MSFNPYATMVEAIEDAERDNDKRAKVAIREYERRLRDEFAMAALTGLIAMCADPNCSSAPDEDRAAKDAYAYADAMLKARKAKEPK